MNRRISSLTYEMKEMGAAMDEYDAKYGEDPGLPAGSVGRGSTGAYPETVNGRVMALVVCRCGASATTPIKVVERDDKHVIAFDEPEGWIVDVDYPYAKNPDEAAIVRCPKHVGVYLGKDS